MKEGDKITPIVGEGSPWKGRARAVPAALLIYGVQTAGQKPLWDYVTDESGEPKREHRWLFDGACRIRIGAVEAEELTIKEFQTRFESDQWCIEHRSHPIALLRYYFDQLTVFAEKSKGWQPGQLLRNGDNVVMIGPHMSDEDKAEALRKFTES
mgnify:CR=1 FL=1